MMHKSGVLVVAPTATVGEALESMVAAEVGSVLVASLQDEILGIVTERDVLKHWKSLSKEGFSRQPVTKIMTQPVFCLLSHELHKAVLVMLERKIRHIPILGAKKALIGVMSIRDVLQNYHLYSLPQNQIPSLNPIDPKPSTKRIPINLVSPTSGLETILNELFGSQLEFNVKSDAQEFINSKDFTDLQTEPVFVDVDGVPKLAWQNMVKALIAGLPAKQPRLFIFMSPNSHAQEEIDSLRAVSTKLHWHVYTRPVPIAALVNDLAALKLPKPQK